MIIYDDTPRAIPADDPFNPMPEPREIGQAMQAKRDELREDGVEEEKLEALLQIWAVEALPVEDPRPVPDMPHGENWRFQPRDPETGKFTKDDD